MDAFVRPAQISLAGITAFLSPPQFQHPPPGSGSCTFTPLRPPALSPPSLPAHALGRPFYTTPYGAAHRSLHSILTYKSPPIGPRSQFLSTHTTHLSTQPIASPSVLAQVAHFNQQPTSNPSHLLTPLTLASHVPPLAPRTPLWPRHLSPFVVRRRRRHRDLVALP